MTTYTPDDANAALDGLLDTPAAVRLEEPIPVGAIIALADEVGRARAERDTAQARLQAIRQAVWPLLKVPGVVGDLARTINAHADPQQPVPAA